jgi:hypothetical protein
VLNHVSGHKAGIAGVYSRATYEREKRAAPSCGPSMSRRRLIVRDRRADAGLVFCLGSALRACTFPELSIENASQRWARLRGDSVTS